VLRASHAVPKASDLGLGQELLHLLLRIGKLIRVSDDLVYLPEQIDELVATIKSMGEDFTVAEFRDKTGLSRKYAVPLLEWSDREGLTIRRGDTRRPR
jgi:selenocysteine-specific elongation factor